jgi:predicted AAA+ superfamily ATPase
VRRHAGNTELYYWQRSGGRQGKIDYLIQAGGRIIPIEVKSGNEGSMKSLHQFMFDKTLDTAVRFDTNNFSLAKMDIKTTQGDPASYSLFSLPIYMAERVLEFDLKEQ